MRYRNIVSLIEELLLFRIYNCMHACDSYNYYIPTGARLLLLHGQASFGQYPLLAPSVRGPQNSRYASAIHKDAHTRILKTFEDSEPTGLKVDIAVTLTH